MRWLIVVLLLHLSLAALPAGDWPGWRGPTGQGVSDEKNLPLNWNARTGLNVLWKAELPGGDGKQRQDQNQSSPIVQKGKVFLTVSVWPAGLGPKQFPEHRVLGFDAEKGTPLFSVTVKPGPWSRASDLRGGYTVPTPAADDQRVYVVFGSSVLAALDHAGKQLWRKEIVPYDFDVALASSPVLYRGLILMQLDGVKNSRLVAYEAKTGEVKWEQKRPTSNFSHSTPVLAPVKGKPQLLVAGSGALQGISPTDGKVIWSCQASGDTVSPVMGKGLVYVDSGRGSSGVCVDPTGSGEVTKTHRKWKIDRVPGGFSSPVVVGDRLYRLTDPGVLHARTMTTGEEVSTLRLPGVSTAPSPFTTPDGRIYLASAGKSYVVKAGEKPTVLATNDLGDNSSASPAVANGRIYLKGRRSLWCIGQKK